MAAPKSLDNLRPRSPDYPEPKRDRGVTVTATGWDGARQAAQAIGITSISALLEKIGRGEVSIAIK